MKITQANIKGDDHKTKGRIGNKQTLELSKWGGVLSGAITTLTGIAAFTNLIVEYEDGRDDLPELHR